MTESWQAIVFFNNTDPRFQWETCNWFNHTVLFLDPVYASVNLLVIVCDACIGKDTFCEESCSVLITLITWVPVVAHQTETNTKPRSLKLGLMILILQNFSGAGRMRKLMPIETRPVHCTITAKHIRLFSSHFSLNLAKSFEQISKKLGWKELSAKQIVMKF